MAPVGPVSLPVGPVGPVTPDGPVTPVGPVGPGSSILVPFTVSGATVAAGTCAGFQFCFQPVSQKKTQPICCLSKISRPRDKDLVIEWNPAGRTLLTAHGLVTLAVRNLSPETVTASFLLGQSGTTELSLDGNFATGADGSSGTPQNTLPFDLTIPGNSAVPLTLHARAVSTIFPGITPWNEWSIIRLCRNGTPTEVEIIGTALFHAPQQLPAPAGSAAGMSMNGRLTLNWAASTAAFPALACEIPDGHTTELLASPSLKSWQRVWPVGENLLHFPDGSFTASQQNTFLQTPDTPAEKQFFRLRSRN